jgi:hypothetical protein
VATPPATCGQAPLHIKPLSARVGKEVPQEDEHVELLDSLV